MGKRWAMEMSPREARRFKLPRHDGRPKTRLNNLPEVWICLLHNRSTNDITWAPIWVVSVADRLQGCTTLQFSFLPLPQFLFFSPVLGYYQLLCYDEWNMKLCHDYMNLTVQFKFSTLDLGRDDILVFLVMDLIFLSTFTSNWVLEWVVCHRNGGSTSNLDYMDDI